MTFENILLTITSTLTALVSGLFLGYSVSVIPAFKHLKDTEYVRAMQAINSAILNPTFFLSFMGPLVLLPLSAFLETSWNYLHNLRTFAAVVATVLIFVACLR